MDDYSNSLRHVERKETCLHQLVDRKWLNMVMYIRDRKN